MNWAVAIGSMMAILLMLVSLILVDTRMLPAIPWVHSLFLSLACASAGAISWICLVSVLVPDITEQVALPVAGLAAIASYLATVAVRAAGSGTIATVVFAAIWNSLVFVPIAICTFSTTTPSWGADISPIDHGGALAVNVAAGAAAFGVLLCGAPKSRTASVSRTAGLIGVIGLCSGWLVWLAGAEFAVDEVSASILVNGLAGGGGGIVGWLVVQRIRHRSVSLNSVAAGVISGLVAVTAGAPLFTPVSAAASGILAGAAACFFTLREVRRSRRQQWYVVGIHLIAGAVGVILLGLLASNRGFVFTGSVALIQSQVLGTLLVAAYSCGVSVALWLVLRTLSRVAQRRGVASQG